jgi:hypothetical protein
MKKGKGMLRWGLLFLLATLWAGQLAAQDTISNEVVRLINAARSAAGAPSLFWNEQLAAAALDHSRDMARQGTLSHVGSDGSQFWERAARAGYVMVTGAQNVLARADLSAQNTVGQWQQNEANNANLLNPDYQEVGFAFARGDNGTVYYTLLLGQRANFSTPAPTPTLLPTATDAPLELTAALETPTVAATATTFSTAAPLPTRDPLVLTLSAPLPTATLDPRLSVTPPPRPTLAVTTAPPQPQLGLRLFISQETVTIQATGAGDVDLSDIVLVSERGSLPLTRFDNGFLTAPLTAFPALDCLQVWSTGVNQVLPRPAQCGVRHSWIVVTEPAAFWVDVDLFRVERDGAVIGRCSVTPDSPTVCDVSLTGAGVPLPTSTPAPPSSAVVNAGVVRLLISEDGVTLQNLTGNSLDVSAYVFVGPNGRFAASAWRTPELSRPLEAIPGGDCLQVWAVGVSSLPKPETCRFRHGWVVVPASRQFWGEGDFQVLDGDRLLGRCTAGQAVCDLRP